MPARLSALIVAMALSLCVAMSAAGQEATPAAGADLLFAGAIPPEVLPTEAGPVYVARVTYDSGAGEDVPPNNGLLVLAIEQGSLRLTTDGPGRLLGTGHPEPGEPLAAGSTRELAAGQGALVPAGTGATVTNATGTATTVIYLGVYPAIGYEPLTETTASPIADAALGTLTWPLLGKGSPTSALPASTMTVERVPVAAGTTLGPRVEQGAAILYVEDGTLELQVEQGLVEASSGAFLRTGAVGPGAAMVSAGSERRIRAEASLFVQPGTTFTLRNSSPEAATLLVVRLDPRDETTAATPPA
jgi:hypothetical protein